MDPLPPERFGDIVERYKSLTDSKEYAHVVARWCHDSLRSARDAEAVLEIGVREGGMSAMFCELAAAMAGPRFRVLSVDPYGESPVFVRDRVENVYGDDYYDKARQTLTRFRNSLFYCMTDELFLHHVLPSVRWWHGGAERPASARFLAFSFLDGPHENTAVVEEFLAVLRHTAPGGAIAIDNAEYVSEAVEMLRGSQRLRVTLEDAWGPMPGQTQKRALFRVPAD